MYTTLLVHKCTIQVRGSLGTGLLGPVEGWTDEQVDVACRFQMLSADMVLRLYGEAVIKAAKVFLPSMATITENTRRVVTTQQGYAGTWIVKGVYPKYGFGDTIDHYEANLIPDISTTAGQ